MHNSCSNIFNIIPFFILDFFCEIKQSRRITVVSIFLELFLIFKRNFNVKMRTVVLLFKFLSFLCSILNQLVSVFIIYFFLSLENQVKAHNIKQKKIKSSATVCKPNRQELYHMENHRLHLSRWISKT